MITTLWGSRDATITSIRQLRVTVRDEAQRFCEALGSRGEDLRAEVSCDKHGKLKATIRDEIVGGVAYSVLTQLLCPSRQVRERLHEVIARDLQGVEGWHDEQRAAS